MSAAPSETDIAIFQHLSNQQKIDITRPPRESPSQAQQGPSMSFSGPRLGISPNLGSIQSQQLQQVPPPPQYEDTLESSIPNPFVVSGIAEIHSSEEFLDNPFDGVCQEAIEEFGEPGEFGAGFAQPQARQHQPQPQVPPRFRVMPQVPQTQQAPLFRPSPHPQHPQPRRTTSEFAQRVRERLGGGSGGGGVNRERPQAHAPQQGLPNVPRPSPPWKNPEFQEAVRRVSGQGQRQRQSSVSQHSAVSRGPLASALRQFPTDPGVRPQQGRAQEHDPSQAQFQDQEEFDYSRGFGSMSPNASLHPTADPIRMRELQAMAPAPELPFHVDDEEERHEKQITLIELRKLETQGVKLTRSFSMSDSLFEMKLELERQKDTQDTVNTVSFMRDSMCMILSALEMLNNRFGPFLSINGWSDTVCKDPSRYNHALERIYKKFWRKSEPSPIMELGWLIIGSMMVYHFKNKFLGGKFSMPGMDPSSAAPNAAGPDPEPQRPQQTPPTQPQQQQQTFQYPYPPHYPYGPQGPQGPPASQPQQQTFQYPPQYPQTQTHPHYSQGPQGPQSPQAPPPNAYSIPPIPPSMYAPVSNPTVSPQTQSPPQRMTPSSAPLSKASADDAGTAGVKRRAVLRPPSSRQQSVQEPPPQFSPEVFPQMTQMLPPQDPRVVQQDPRVVPPQHSQRPPLSQRPKPQSQQSQKQKRRYQLPTIPEQVLPNVQEPEEPLEEPEDHEEPEEPLEDIYDEDFDALNSLDIANMTDAQIEELARRFENSGANAGEDAEADEAEEDAENPEADGDGDGDAEAVEMYQQMREERANRDDDVLSISIPIH